MVDAAGGGPIAWNDGIDYAASFRNGDVASQRATRAPCQAAGVSLDADLRALRDAPRTTADARAIKWWSSPGRTVLGEPTVPVLRVHTSGDGTVAPAMVQGYDAAVKERGYTELYRTAFVRAPGHCTFTPAEIAASVETVMRRLNTGRWGSTSPDSLNALARELDSGTAARFFAYEQVKYNRAWLPTLAEYLGLGVRRDSN